MLLIQDPDLLMLDEPVAGVSVSETVRDDARAGLDEAAIAKYLSV
jgi:ABC-type uncharacterized transport system ATPase subunit